MQLLNQIIKKDTPEIEECLFHINNIHQNGKNICFFFKNQQFAFQKFYKLNQIQSDYTILQQVINYSKTYDVYISQNSFLKEQRSKDCLWSSQTIILDIDHYNMPEFKDLDSSSVIELMKMDEVFNNIINPNYVIHSGKGFNLVFLLETIPLHLRGNQRLWEMVIEALIDRFRPYGADPNTKDLTRVNRLPATINHKNMATTKIIGDIKTHRGSLSEFADELLPYSLEEVREYKKKKKNKKKQKKASLGKIHKLHNIHSLHYSRVQDFEKLVELRYGEFTGKRELLIFLYSLSLQYVSNSIDYAYKSVYELNKQLTAPLDHTEVDHAFNTALNSFYTHQEIKRKGFTEQFINDGVYKYKNATIVDILEVNWREERQMKTLISQKEKNRRDKERKKENRRNTDGKTDRQRQKEINMQKVQSLLSQGSKQKEIAEELQLSKSYVSEIVKELKNQE